MAKSQNLKIKEKQDLIEKIQKYLRENEKDGLLIYEVHHLEPYFNILTGVPCSISALLYIPKEEKPKCVVSNLEVNAIRSINLFEEENISEYTDLFTPAAKKFINSLKGKKVLVNFSEEDALADQLPHSFFNSFLQDLNAESSKDLWRSIGLKIKEKKYMFTTSLKVKKSRIAELKHKFPQHLNKGFLMINGVSKASSQTYACYLMSFLNKQKYAVAAKSGEVIAVMHEDELLNNHPFDKLIPYKNIQEFQKIISDYFHDVKEVFCDTEMSEGNYRLAKKTLEDKFTDSPNKIVGEMLSVKLPEEIKEIEKACKINDNLFDYLEKNLRIGMSEYEVSNLIEKKALGYPKVLEMFFQPLVAAGKNSMNIHHLTSDYKIQKDDLLLVDLGVRMKTGMGSDTTCMFYFGDSIPKRVKKYDEIMDKAIISAVKKIMPGKPKTDSDLAARDEIAKHYPNFMHGTGHGVDIKCHGSGEPITDRPKGFYGIGEVLTIEPGIYITEKYVPKEHPKIEGFRKEIMVLVTKDGSKELSKIPKLRLIKR